MITVLSIHLLLRCFSSIFCFLLVFVVLESVFFSKMICSALKRGSSSLLRVLTQQSVAPKVFSGSAYFATRKASTLQHRYLPNTEHTRKEMLDVIGVNSVDDLFNHIPENLRVQAPLDLPPPKTELEILKDFKTLNDKCLPASNSAFFIGGGIYRHHVPAVVDHLIQRSEFLTSYTPYQPEVSQGTLQAMFEFQTQVCLLTGMEVANASMYDGGTACTEAVLMASRVNRRKKVVLSGGLHPHSAETVKSSLQFVDFDINSLPPNPSSEEDLTSKLGKDVACVVVQNPDVFGVVRDYSGLAAECKRNGCLLVVNVSEALSLGALKNPGMMGADIVVGEGQSLAGQMNFGGPTVGLMATRGKYMRQMPGRFVGETVDTNGERAFVLTLGTREQHIRREKATSNICTSGGLMALSFSIHTALLGEKGLRELAYANHHKAIALHDKIKAELPSVNILNNTFFNEFTIELPAGVTASHIVNKLANERILAGVPGGRLFGQEHDNILITAVTELNSEHDMNGLIAALKRRLPK
eukprot:GCRY01001302.1.p1 GENE.GCRY01001302.1~~GCRY01001302.1.p1  ORF type:complete len:527 (+),score=133.36 GCRY01001302.1:198-1778(+)